MKKVFENIKLCLIICGSILILVSILGFTNLNIVTAIGLIFIAIPMFMSAFEIVMDYDFSFLTVLYAAAGSLLFAAGILLI